MPFVDAYEQSILNGLLVADPTYSAPTTVYMGVSTTTPTDAGGNVTEPSGGSYARQALTAATFGAASGTAPATKASTSAVTFPQASGSWGTLTHAVFYDASTAGNIVAWAALNSSVAIASGDTLNFAVGAIVPKFGKPADSY